MKISLLSLVFAALVSVVSGSITPAEPSGAIAAAAKLRGSLTDEERKRRHLEFGDDQTNDGGTTKAPTPSPICFSGVTTVEVEGVGAVPTQDLQVGSKVLTSKKKFQTVYASAHHAPHQPAEFLQFQTTSSDNAMEVTADHLVYKRGTDYPVRASSIKVGDSLIYFYGTQEETPMEITSIQKVTRTGVYAPLTADGTLLVNGGYKASNYATPTGHDSEGYDPQYVEFQGGISSGISQQAMTHYLLAPLRLLCLGIAPQVCRNEVLLDRQGLPHYIHALLDLAHYARVHFSAAAQAVMMVLFVVILAPFAITEALVGPVLAPWLLVFLGVGAVRVYYGRKQVNKKAKVA